MWRVIAAYWYWRADVMAVLGALAVLYILGWRTLRRAGHTSLASWPGFLAYLGGLGVVAVALLSPLAVFQSLLLSLHMIQHELLMVVAAPLVLLARPLAITLWGMPVDLRQEIGRLLRPRKPLRRMFDLLTRPVIAWTVSTALLWLWHIPVAYDAVEVHRFLHDVQHLSFFLSGLLFWWPVIQAPPFSHAVTLPLCVGYLLAGITQRSLLGGVITLASRVLYSHYSDGPRIGPSSALNDQHFAGGIMWFASGLVLLVVGLLLIWEGPGDEPSTT